MKQHIELSPRLRLGGGPGAPGGAVGGRRHRPRLSARLPAAGGEDSLGHCLRPASGAAEPGPGDGAAVRLRGQDGLSAVYGLAGIRSGEVDAVVIAGMGGETIAQILEAAPWVLEEKIPLVLQPMSSLPELRTWLGQHGYAIAREQLCQEGETLYVVMQVTAGEMGPQTPGQLWVGRQSRDPLRGAYLEQQERKLRRAVDGMAKSLGEETQQRRRELEAVLHEIAAMKEEWQKWQV